MKWGKEGEKIIYTGAETRQWYVPGESLEFPQWGSRMGLTFLLSFSLAALHLRITRCHCGASGASSVSSVPTSISSPLTNSPYITTENVTAQPSNHPQCCANPYTSPDYILNLPIQTRNIPAPSLLAPHNPSFTNQRAEKLDSCRRRGSCAKRRPNSTCRWRKRAHLIKMLRPGLAAVRI